MIIKITGVIKTPFSNGYPQEQEPKTKYYQPPTQKETVKKDFGIILDAEIKKLHFEAFV